MTTYDNTECEWCHDEYSQYCGACGLVDDATADDELANLRQRRNSLLKQKQHLEELASNAYWHAANSSDGVRRGILRAAARHYCDQHAQIVEQIRTVTADLQTAGEMPVVATIGADQ